MAGTSRGKTVCFVCYGNMCRSPMAVALMADIIQKDPGLTQSNIEICSAGTGAMRGRGAHSNAQEVMREQGLTLDHHVTSPLSKHVVDRADLIVAMDPYVREDMIAWYPESSQKTYTLDIADPYGQLVEAYRQCAQEIRDSCVSRVLPLLKSLA